MMNMGTMKVGYARTSTVEQIAADFRGYQEVGVNRFLIGLGPAPPAEYERRLRRFAEEVRPALAASVVHSAP